MCRLLTTALVFLIALLPIGCHDKSNSQGTASLVTAGRKTMPRDEFAKAVTGKNGKEVVAAVGEPDFKVEAQGKDQWSYAGLTTDPASGKPDFKTTLFFDGGRVARIEYADKP